MYSDKEKIFLSISPTSAACTSGVKSNSWAGEHERKAKKRPISLSSEKVKVVKGHDMQEEFMNVVESIHLDDDRLFDCNWPAKKQKCLPTFNVPCDNIYLTSSSSSINYPKLSPCNMSTTRKRHGFIVKGKEMRSFFRLLDDEVVQEFLDMDSCLRISDKYLLAMVFAYFKRAQLRIREYTRMNFFIALYLANDMEEDEEEDKYEIYPWALGQKWKDKFIKFLRKRDLLWAKIGYRAVVSKRCCEEIMAFDATNPAWKRNRPIHHAGAIRNYARDPNDDGYPRGPDASPRYCGLCDKDSQYDSASPASDSWYISSGHSSPVTACTSKDTGVFRFNMKRLERNLPDQNLGRPTYEE